MGGSPSVGKNRYIRSRIHPNSSATRVLIVLVTSCSPLARNKQLIKARIVIG